jgi:hypothetical protein
MRHQYIGPWRIIEMEQWDQDYIDLVVPGYFSFREDHLGEFQFGTVHGEIDYLSLSRLSCTCIQGLANRALRHTRWRPRCLLASEARQT